MPIKDANQQQTKKKKKGKRCHRKARSFQTKKTTIKNSDRNNDNQ